MKFSVVGFLTAIGLSVSGLAISSSSYKAIANTTYYCGTHDGRPATIARRTGAGSVALISWRTMFFGERYTPPVRCGDVTENFNNLMTGQYRYVVWGTRNGQNVMCASNRGPRNTPEECPSSRMLFTLEPEDDPIQAIRHLGRLSSLSGEGPYVSPDPVFIESPDGRSIGVDWEQLMQRAPESCQNLWGC